MALEELTMYESAAVAATNVENAGLAVTSMRDFYNSRGVGDSAVIQRALADAFEGQKNGAKGISHPGVVKDIGIYSGKYEAAFVDTKISDIIGYLSDGYNMPEKAKLSLESFGDKTFRGLSEEVKANGISEDSKKEIRRAIATIELLKNRKMQAGTLGVVNKNTTQNLEALYTEEA